MVVVAGWVPGGGCRGVGAGWWLSRGGCQVVVVMGWVSGGGCRGVGARWWFSWGGCRVVVE